MNGEFIKKRIRVTAKTQKEIEDILQITSQSLTSILNSIDVKSGTLERLCDALDVGIEFFYAGTKYAKNGNVVVANGDNSQAANGNIQVDTYVDGNIFYGCDGAKFGELLQSLIDSNARLTKELDKSQQQKDSLIKIINNLTTK